MVEIIKTDPQVKVTCKQILPKLIIESVDKHTLNNLRKSIAKYYLTIELIAKYQGELDEKGNPVDVADYELWKENHPNKISKQSVNNIIKSIKNKSLVNWNAYGIEGIGYNSAVCSSNEFYITLLSIGLIKFVGGVTMTTNLSTVSYSVDGGLDIDYLNSNFKSQ